MQAEKNAKGGVRTLQPLSTSMPTTCHRSTKVRAPRRECANLLEHMLVPAHVADLRACVQQSIANIEADVYDSVATVESILMRATVARAEHTVLVALFMLLLNVDARLKERVVAAASADKKHKVVRLLEDLRKHLVVEFLTDEKHSTSAFVHTCEDTYVIS